MAGKVVLFLATCFLLLGELEQVLAAPLSLHAQYQAALQQVAELKGNGTFKDCCDIRQAMKYVFGTNQPEHGIFDIPDVCGEQTNSFFPDIPATQARCDFEDGGGWVVILRRKADVQQQVNFVRLWDDYERGFGDLNTEFWYGLRNIHCLTTREEVELQIELRQDNGTGEVWTYGNFVVDGPENNYTLHIGQAERSSGDGRESMVWHNGMQFSTTDRDNDKNPGNCANNLQGSGWWYISCHYSLLTGRHSTRKLHWRDHSVRPIYYPFAEMKLRPKRCTSEGSCN